MELILSYKIAWNTPKNEGTIILNVNNGVKQLHIDSAAEAMLVLDILRHEKPVFVKGDLIYTGFEPTGEGEDDQSVFMNAEQAASLVQSDGSAGAYKVTWNTASDEGIFIVTDKDGAHQLFADSATEGMLVLDLLRNEQKVYVKDKMVFTGFEKV